MRITIRFVLFIGLCGVCHAEVPARERMVVLISLDGVPASYLSDPKLPIPALRRLASEGVSARMTNINPTVTWPNHTTFVTGVRADEHGLLVNGSIVPTGKWPPVRVEPMVDQKTMVHAPTVYDAAHAAGLTTAQVDWVAINKAAGITWAFAEWASPEGPLEQEMIRKRALDEEEVRNFTRPNILYRDQVWAKAAAYLIREHKPNLLLVHFLSLDSVHHRFGPSSLAATAAVAFLDSCVEEIVQAVREAGMQDRTTFLIVSDHGFKAFNKEIRPARALDSAGLADRAFVLPEGGSALVYVDRAQREAILPRVRKALESVEGIDQVVGTEGYPALGLPSPDRDPQMGDLFLTAKAGYSFADAKGGPVTAATLQTGGSHGYPASDPDMNAIFVAAGYGIERRGDFGPISSIDVAPTIAKLLGVQLPSAKGKPLSILALH